MLDATQWGGMSRKLTTRDLRLLDQDEYGATSPVYRHIRDNYVDMVSHKVGSRDGPSWATVAQMLARRGHTNGRGQPLTADTVRKLFKRVALEVAKRPDQQPHKLEPTQHPSRQRPDWQPPLAASQGRPEPRTPPPRQPPTETLPRAGPVEGTGNADAKLAAAKRQFDWIDRHIVQQPDEE